MKPKIYIPLLFSVLLLTVSCNEDQSKDPIFEQGKIPVDLMPINQDKVSSVFKTSGYFTTDDETPLSFINGGIIQEIYVDEGDAIEAGQLLATVKAIEVQAALKRAKLHYEKAKRDYERAVNLYQDSVATLEQKQNAKTALKMARQQRRVAQFNLKHSEIRALHDGYVLERYLNEGQLAGSGTPVLLVNSPSEGEWMFKTSVSAKQWAALQVGDSATITSDAIPGVTIPATLIEKSKGVDPTTGGFTLRLSIESNKDLPLATGLFGEANLFPSSKQKAWRIPYGSLLDGESNTGYVFITNDKKHAQKVKVSIANIEHGHVVINSGLKDAKSLIVSGSAYLEDGSEISVNKK